MAEMTVAQWRQYARQWERAAPELKRIHDEELANWKYDPKVVDALLEIGANSPKRREDESNGLFETQKWFIKIAQKQRLIPSRVREDSVAYCMPELRGRDRIGSKTAGTEPGPPDTMITASLLEPEGRPPCRPPVHSRVLNLLGEKALLNRPKLALFCSVKCPGRLILEAYDLCRRLREQGITVVGGFHSPMEQECMRILLKSPYHVVWCLARGLMKRHPPGLRLHLAEARLLLVTPFPQTVHRQTAATCIKRNRIVADMAAACIVVHAAPGSKIEALCRELLAVGKPVYTFAHPANEAIIHVGARPIVADTDWAKLLQSILV